MKKISLKKKNATLIYLGNCGAVHLWKKHATSYNGGIIAVRTKDKQLHVFTTEQQNEIRLLIGGENDKNSMIFEDTNLNQNWETVFCYLFESDSAMLFFGERDITDQMGVYKVHGYSYEILEVQKMAYHVATLMDSSLLNLILHLENKATQESYELSLWLE